MRSTGLTILALFVLGCASSPSGHTTSTNTPATRTPAEIKADEDSILKEAATYATAWGTGDGKLCASFFTEDAARTDARGVSQHGRAELEQAYTEMLTTWFKGAHLNQEVGTVRMLTPEYAFWEAGIEVTHPTGPANKGNVIHIYKKVDGRWLILEAHPKLYPSLPPPPKP